MKDYATAYGVLTGAITIAVIDLQFKKDHQQIAEYLKGALHRAELAKNKEEPNGNATPN